MAEQTLGAALTFLSLLHRLPLLSTAAQLALGNTDTWICGLARSNVHTDKHSSHSLVWKRTKMHTTLRQLFFSLLLLEEFVLLSESLLRGEPASVNMQNRLIETDYSEMDACKKNSLHVNKLFNIWVSQGVSSNIKVKNKKIHPREIFMQILFHIINLKMNK